MLKKIDPTITKSWHELDLHFNKEMKSLDLKTLFSSNNTRFDKFSIIFDNKIFLDYSKNHITQKTKNLLLDFAKEIQLKDAIEKMFTGDIINETENRAVLHTALRDVTSKKAIILNNDKDIKPAISEVLKQMKIFSEKVRKGEWKGYSGKKISDIINIGIGGSDLGPSMACEALKNYADRSKLNVSFVSNIDGAHLSEILLDKNPETTLFLIASKTFTTIETMTNAGSAKKWFLDTAKDNGFIKKHFIAISTNTEKVTEFGIDPKNMFKFWDFVGGRYSLFSAIGLSICLYVGYENFNRMIIGANKMDIHFRESEFDKNIPVILALISFWYNNFYKTETEVILPYDQYLNRFPAYLQQANMESNGKSVDRSGKKISGYQTGPIIWGEPGTNGQHAFYQLIHQGTKLIPADFLAPVNPNNPLCKSDPAAADKHHKILLSNFFAQTEALMNGKSEEEVIKDLGNNSKDLESILPYKIFDGNKPTNSILYKELNPEILGMLIAMYEHKIFTQGIFWNIFSFDQWGVQLGKDLASKIIPELDDDKDEIKLHDSSTNGLINIYKKMKK